MREEMGKKRTVIGIDFGRSPDYTVAVIKTENELTVKRYREVSNQKIRNWIKSIADDCNPSLILINELPNNNNMILELEMGGYRIKRQRITMQFKRDLINMMKQNHVYGKIEQPRFSDELATELALFAWYNKQNYQPE